LHTSGNVGRTNDFREDYKVKTGSASLSDYKGSGYDRGHLAPAGDMKIPLNLIQISAAQSKIPIWIIWQLIYV